MSQNLHNTSVDKNFFSSHIYIYINSKRVLYSEESHTHVRDYHKLFCIWICWLLSTLCNSCLWHSMALRPHLQCMIMKLVHNQSFTLTTGNGQQSRLGMLEVESHTGRSWLPSSSNIYLHDLPEMVSAEYAYADDFAILQVTVHWSTLEGILTQDNEYFDNLSPELETETQQNENSVSSFPSTLQGGKSWAQCYNWRPTSALSPSTLVWYWCSCFRELMDRLLMFCQHLESLCKKLTSDVMLLRKLAGSSWEASAQTLYTTALALVYSAAEHCASAWCHSAHTHQNNIAINNALLIVTE